MPDRQSPTLRRRRLSTELRRLREEAGLSSTEVARRLEWSAGKLTRLERNEGKRPDPRDVRDLCEIYKTDETLRDYLTQLARDGRMRGWWDPYHSMLSEELSTYIGLEAEAAMVLSFEPLMVPGLFQTEAYARAIIQGGPAEIADDEVDTRVDIRMRRQKALYEDPALRVVAVMDEAVLHRQVGSDEIMAAQMYHLRSLARLPRVTLHVIPFAAGAHASMTTSFHILQFPEPTDTDAVYVDLLAGEIFMEEPAEVDRFHLAFTHLVGSAASARDTLALIADR